MMGTLCYERKAEVWIGGGQTGSSDLFIKGLAAQLLVLSDRYILKASEGLRETTVATPLPPERESCRQGMSFALTQRMKAGRSQFACLRAFWRWTRMAVRIRPAFWRCAEGRITFRDFRITPVRPG